MIIRNQIARSLMSYKQKLTDDYRVPIAIKEVDKNLHNFNPDLIPQDALVVHFSGTGCKDAILTRNGKIVPLEGLEIPSELFTVNRRVKIDTPVYLSAHCRYIEYMMILFNVFKITPGPPTTFTFKPRDD